MIATLLELVGFGLILAGCFMLAVWLGLIVAGFGLIVAGAAIDNS